MPTQTEFLSNPGLVPQTTTADCMICHDQAVSPVTTSGCECRVTYCRQCILDWYTGGGNKCPTCRVEVYSLDTSDSDSESDSDSDDSDIEDGAPRFRAPRFGLNVTIANGEGDEMFYLLRDNPWDLDNDEAVESIRNFRSSSIDAEMPIDQRSHRPALRQSLPAGRLPASRCQRILPGATRKRARILSGN
ncbi:unnamed protein product [Cercospora beticola]|nr:unnamed protein product [Cercospora beticola]